jgi:hypothetical protein
MRLPLKRVYGSLAAAVVLVGLSAPADAAFVQYSNRATFDALGPFVGVDWGVFGPDGTAISTPDSRTVGGIKVGVTSSQGVLQRYNEGTTFIGNFAVGDHLLGDAGSESDSFIVSFGSPVKGFGAQVDSHYISGPYSGRIDFFSATNVLLFSAPFSGTNTLAQDNTAPFVGVTSNLSNISYAAFLIDQSFDPNLPPFAGSLLINRLDVIAIPEASALALMGAAFIGFFTFGSPRRKAGA